MKASALTIGILIVALLVRPTYAPSAHLLSVQGDSNGISGKISISDADGTMWYSTCSIIPSKQGSHGGLTGVVPMETPANGDYSFNCYFDGPSERGAYLGRIQMTFWPPFVTGGSCGVMGCENTASAYTWQVLAGGGSGVPLTTTFSTQSTSNIHSTTQIQTTPTSTLSISSSTSIVSPTEHTVSSVYSSILQTSPGPVLPMSYIEYLGVILVLGAIAVGAILISGKRERKPRAAKERTSKVKARKGAQFCVNCGVELPLKSKFCNKCGAAQS